MNVTLISPYHGGSHQAWAEGYQAASQHDISLLTMPGRFWKWRMHGGAVTLARRFREARQHPDLILATDMLDVTTFLALTRPFTANIPLALYMHENQLTYPLPANRRSGPMRRQHGERDRHYVFINFASMLAANHVFFNSHYHRNSFLQALPRYLKHFPEYNELNTIHKLAGKSSVLPVGINFSRLGSAPAQHNALRPPLILWNQRWEYDKNPRAFFSALYQLQESGVPFQLALCGQRFGKQPPIFTEALRRLKKEVVHVGYANDTQYRQLLWEAAVTVSTARHEFFGISILEAIYCQTLPLMPNRLSYPEIIPAAFHHHCFYRDEADLVARLADALQQRPQTAVIATQLAQSISHYDWSHQAPHYDQALTAVVHNHQNFSAAT